MSVQRGFLDGMQVEEEEFDFKNSRRVSLDFSNSFLVSFQQLALVTLLQLLSD